MRSHPWIAALSSMCLLLAAGESSGQSHRQSAQRPSFDEAVAGQAHLSSEPSLTDQLQIRGQTPSPAYGGEYGPSYGTGFQPAYSSNNPAAFWPPGTPPSYQPYPAISPYFPPNVARESTYNDRGLWFKEILHQRRDYYFTLEYLSSGYAGPGNSNIGAPTIPVNYVTNEPWGFVINNYGLGGPADFGGFIEPVGPQRVLIGPGVLPYPVFPEAEGGPDVVHFENFAFPIHTLDVINNPVNADGIRARWGYDNEDGTGVMLSGWYAGLGKDRFQRGTDNWNGIPITQDLILANTPSGGFAPVFPRNGALPLELPEGMFIPPGNDQGVTEDYGFTGWAQKFDVLFQVEAETRSFGSTLNLYHDPIYKKKWVKVRPTYGARYMYVDDRFSFRGIDSGLFYEVDFGGSGTGGGGGGGGIGGGIGGGDDGGGTGGGAGAGGGAGGSGAPTYRPPADSVFIFTDENGVPLDFFFDAHLKSQVDTHLAGPEAGIRYDFGQSKNFAIWGQSTFALLANHERIKLSGEDIGLPYEYFLSTGDNFVDDPDIDTRFSQTVSHTHVSPMFEQSIFLEANLLKYVPLINQVHWLEAAQFQFGYTYTVVGRMARSGESIRWRAFPDVPNVDIDYRTWYVQNWSFGLNWNF